MHYFNNKDMSEVLGPQVHKVSVTRAAKIFLPVIIAAAAISFIFGIQLSLVYFNKWAICSVFAVSGFFLIQASTANHGYKSSILLLFFFSYIRSALITIESFNTPIYYTYHSQNKKKMASLGIRRPPMRSKSKLQLIGFKEEKERREKKKQFSENYRKETSL